MATTTGLRAPKLTGTHIADLLASSTSVLVQDETGRVEVLPDLTGDLLDEPGCVVLRDHEWAVELLAAASDEASELGQRAARRTLLAAAGREGTAELAAETVRVASFLARSAA
jgi:hypothetical protein